MKRHYNSGLNARNELDRCGIFSSLLHASIFILAYIKGMSSCPAENGVLAELLTKPSYMKYSRPVQNSSDTLTIYLKLQVLKVIDVDERMESLTANVQHTVTWEDFNLVWNESDHSGLRTVYFPASEIWLPDILIKNSVKDGSGRVGRNNNDEASSNMVRVNSNGKCTWWPTATTVTHCRIDVRWFPYDEQTCRFEYETTGYDNHDIQLTTDRTSSIVNSVELNGEWTFVGHETNVTEIYEASFGATVSRVTIDMKIRRKSSYYAFNFLAPCIILHILSIGIFIIPPNKEDRVEFGVAILLTFTVYQLIISEKLPSTSDAIPFLSGYYLLVMIMSAFSILFCICIDRAIVETEKKSVNTWSLVVKQLQESRNDKKGNNPKVAQIIGDNGQGDQLLLQDRQAVLNKEEGDQLIQGTEPIVNVTVNTMNVGQVDGLLGKAEVVNLPDAIDNVECVVSCVYSFIVFLSIAILSIIAATR